MKIFISHSSNDVQIYESLFRLLVRNKHSVWDPERMKGGTGLSKQLSSATRECDICIFIVTDDSIKSSWCAAELGAFWGSGKNIIPYCLDNEVASDQLPPHLQELLWVSTDEKLIESVNGICNEKQNYHLSVVNRDIEIDDLITKVIEKGNILSRAKLIQYSADNVSKIIEKLLNVKVKVELLLVHPVQIIKTSNAPLINTQLSKIGNFIHKFKSDLPNSENLNIRFYSSEPSMKGMYIENEFCSSGWYINYKNEIRGHDNSQIVEFSNNPAEGKVQHNFKKVFDKLWEESISYEADKDNIENLLALRHSSSEKLKGIVIRGHGVASGKSSGMLGTIEQQQKYLKKIDWNKFWPGTINVSISPNRCLWKSEDVTYEGVPWSRTQPKEDFCLSECTITVRGITYQAWAYYPHPRTKTQNLHDSTTLELISTKIEDLKYGDDVELSINSDEFMVI